MSLFGKLFGKGSKEEALTTGDAIQKLRENEEMLEKKQQFLEKKVETEMATARKNAKTNKRVALSALQRKKRYEKQLQQIDGTLTTLEQQREALESANTNTAVLQVSLLLTYFFFRLSLHSRKKFSSGLSKLFWSFFFICAVTVLHVLNLGRNKTGNQLLWIWIYVVFILIQYMVK